MYVPLSLAKDFCNVTTEVSDVLLQLLIDAAEQRVATYLNRPLTEILDPVTPPDAADPQSYAAAVRLAILLYVSDAVDNRNTIITGTISSELPTAERLLHPYRIGLGV
jgi:hypothetical protein